MLPEWSIKVRAFLWVEADTGTDGSFTRQEVPKEVKPFAHPLSFLPEADLCGLLSLACRNPGDRVSENSASCLTMTV